MHSFTGVGGDGGNPFAGLIFDPSGALYGATVSGGDAGCSSFLGISGCDAVFKLAPPAVLGGSWTESVLHSFTGGSDGSTPFAGLTFDASGALYGATAVGGNTGCALTVKGRTTSGNGCGAVFKLSGAGVPLSKNPQTADFNADHKSDILLQNTNGAAAIWETTRAKVIGSGSPGNPGAAWRAIGTGYFFGSPYADILWQHLDGAVAIWQINQTKAAASATVGKPAASWHAIATGDFNGDSYSDILLQYANGAVEIWEMNGFRPIASAVVGNPGTAWHVISAGDFNGDGKSDILLQNTNGAVAIWEMNGLKVLAIGE